MDHLSSVPQRHINIVLAHNGAGSITRVAAMYANHIVAQGCRVTVSFPVLGEQVAFNQYVAQQQGAALPFMAKQFAKRLLSRPLAHWHPAYHKRLTWVGTTELAIDPRVQFNPYMYLPTEEEMPDADNILVFQGQLLPPLLRLTRRKGVIIDSLHMSHFERDPATQEWPLHLVKTIWRKIHVPRFGVSQEVVDYFRSHGVHVDGVIHNGVDTREFGFVPFAQKEKTILMFCDPRPEKGFHIGLQILQQIRARLPNLKFASVGNVTGLDVSIFDVVHGQVKAKDIAKIYQKYAFFLFPSIREGFPAPPLEAMATGAITFLPKVAGIIEYGEHGSNCFIAEPGQSAEFVSHITSALPQENHLNDMVLAARKTAEKYSWQTSAEKLLNFAGTLR